jgi:hypothetical protein
MPDVKTLSIMPKGDTNGLTAIAGELAAEVRGDRPQKMRAVIALVRPRRAAIDVDGTETVTVEFLRVERLLAEDLPAAEKLLRRALETRSGLTVLELDLEDAIREAFAEMSNPDSPEDPDELSDEPIELTTDPPPRRTRKITPDVLRAVLASYERGGYPAVIASLSCSERYARRLVARARAELPAEDYPDAMHGYPGRDEDADPRGDEPADLQPDELDPWHEFDDGDEDPERGDDS